MCHVDPILVTRLYFSLLFLVEAGLSPLRDLTTSPNSHTRFRASNKLSVSCSCTLSYSAVLCSTCFHLQSLFKPRSLGSFFAARPSFFAISLLLSLAAPATCSPGLTGIRSLQFLFFSNQQSTSFTSMKSA